MADAPNPVKLPVVGKVKPIYVVGGLGLVLGIVGYAWWKNGRASAGDTSGATDAAEASQDAFIPPYAQANTSGGVDLSQLPPLDNPSWGQRVQDALVAIGFDPVFVATTVGKYLSRQPLNPTEADVIRSAIGNIGPPPVGQFAIIPTSTPTTTTPSLPPTTTPTTKTEIRWQGTRLGNDVFLGQLATRHNTTISAILSHNKWLIPLGKTKSTSRLNKGWIVIIPVPYKVAA